MTGPVETPMLLRMGWGRRLLRAPALHFVLAGLALFLAERWWSGRSADVPPDPRDRPILIDEARVVRLRQDFERRHGLPPTPAEEGALLDQEIDEELLYREALARGLDRSDRSIQWWLIKKMRFVAEDPDLDDAALYRQAKELGLDADDVVIRRILAQKMRLLAELAEGPVEPDDAEVAAYFTSNQDEWMRPDRVSLHHVFLSRDRRGAHLEEDAEGLLEEISALGPDQAEDRGDPFPLGRRHRARSQAQLAKLFGPDFAERAMSLETGRWVGPVPSAYGLHLVYVDEKLPAEPADLDSVRNQVSRRLAAEKRAAVLARELARLRDRYEVRIERPAGPGGAGTEDDARAS